MNKKILRPISQNEIEQKITKPIFHEVDVYGSNPDKDHGSDKVIITVFKKI